MAFSKFSMVTVVGLGVLLSSCLTTNGGGGGGGGAGNGAGPGVSTNVDQGGPICAQATSLLRSCGLLSQGIFPCTEPEGTDEVCQANCFLGASCADLTDGLCNASASVSGSASNALADCAKGCGNSVSASDFVCDNGETIPGAWQCDGSSDCSDGSDEVGCTSQSGFQCDGGQTTVSESSQCDGFPDCQDGTDEQGCPVFVCGDGETVPADTRCDENEDCADGSDEVGCAQITCN